MKIIRVRFFNITGPRKVGDACSDFAKMIVDFEKGKTDRINVGNLEGTRDFTDVRDAVRALILLSEKGNLGDVYNVCSGKGIKMKDVLEKLGEFSKKKTGKEIKIFKDPAKIRPIDDPIFIGDNSKIRSLGWKPVIEIDKTLSDTLDYWRDRT